MQDPNRIETMSAGKLDESSRGVADTDSPMPFSPNESPQAEQAKGAPQKTELPLLILTQVGLTAFNGVIVVVYAILWMFNSDLLIRILRGMGGISLLLSIAPVIVGAIILQKNKRREKPMPGSVWASIGVWTGVVMSLMTLAIPVMATFRAIFASSPGVQ